MIKRVWMFFMVFFLLFGISFPASAGNIDFDDLSFSPGDDTLFLDGTSYAGFSWGAGPYNPYGRAWVVTNSSSWFGVSAHSGDNYAWSNGGADLKISSTSPFDFNSMWAGMPTGSLEELNRYGRTATAEGYRDGELIYEVSFLPTSPTTWELFNFDFLRVDEVIIKAFMRNIYLDDIEINSTVPTPVVIDIKPGIDPNTFNCNNENGIIDVAILTTDVFDATTVNHATVTFEEASETHVNNKSGEPKRHEEDVDGDGDTDLVFHFRLGDTNLDCDSTEGTLTGETFDGMPIEGTDSITSEEPYACYEGVPKTGQTTSYAAGDDGDLEKGIAWPDPRFTDNGNGTVTDNLTGLMWLKDANCMATNYPEFDTGVGGDDIAGDGKVEWPRALEFVACMNDENCQDCNAGYTDWRLPNFKEIHSLIDYGNYSPALNTGHPFIIQAEQGQWYWSSTSLPGPGMTTRVLRVNFETADVARNYKTERFYRVWPVRGGN